MDVLLLETLEDEIFRLSDVNTLLSFLFIGLFVIFS